MNHLLKDDGVPIVTEKRNLLLSVVFEVIIYIK